MSDTRTSHNKIAWSYLSYRNYMLKHLTLEEGNSFKYAQHSKGAEHLSIRGVSIIGSKNRWNSTKKKAKQKKTTYSELAKKVRTLNGINRCFFFINADKHTLKIFIDIPTQNSNTFRWY